jgi:hypothetical protein
LATNGRFTSVNVAHEHDRGWNSVDIDFFKLLFINLDGDVFDGLNLNHRLNRLVLLLIRRVFCLFLLWLCWLIILLFLLERRLSKVGIFVQDLILLFIIAFIALIIIVSIIGATTVGFLHLFGDLLLVLKS